MTFADWFRVIFSAYSVLSIIASPFVVIDFYNGKIPTPKDFYNKGYNWFGSGLFFLIRIIIGFPGYVFWFFMINFARFIYWLCTVRRK